METILAAVITGGVTLIGVLIANSKTQAVTETKLEELTRGGAAAQQLRPAGAGDRGAAESGKSPHCRSGRT